MSDRMISAVRSLYNDVTSYVRVNAVRSLYNDVTSCVRVNEFLSDWFNVSTGLRQGCFLSTILFNIYINDLAVSLKSLNKGIDIGNEKICILLYADDIVVIANIMRLIYRKC